MHEGHRHAEGLVELQGRLLQDFDLERFDDGVEAELEDLEDTIAYLEAGPEFEIGEKVHHPACGRARVAAGIGEVRGYVQQDNTEGLVYIVLTVRGEQRWLPHYLRAATAPELAAIQLADPATEEPHEST